jgi:hypothetical protein
VTPLEVDGGMGETASAKRTRRRRKTAAPKPAAKAKPTTAAAPQFGFSPTGDPSQPPSFNPFPGDYSTSERNAARKAATSRVDALIASLPTTKSITGRYGAESAAAGGMAKSLSDHLAQSQLARVGFAGNAPNIFAQSVQSATAPAAGVIGQQTAGAGQGLIAAMAANTANSMAGAPGAATAQGNIVQGAIGRRQTDALNDRAQQATAIRLKLPELTDASLADSRDASYKAWAANENAWMARAQMAQQGNQFNAREANDAAAANAGLAQDTWQTGFTQDQQNARFGAAEAGRNARANAALDKNRDGKVSTAEKAAGTQKKIIDQGLKQAEKWRGQTGPAQPARPWVYRVVVPGIEYSNGTRDPDTVKFEESDYELTNLPDGWTLDRPGAAASPAGPSMNPDELFSRTVQFMVSRGLSRKRAHNVAKRYLGYEPRLGPPAPAPTPVPPPPTQPDRE